MQVIKKNQYNPFFFVPYKHIKNYIYNKKEVNLFDLPL